MMLHCLRRAPRLAVRVQRASFSSTATKAPFKQPNKWQKTFDGTLVTCLVAFCAYGAYGVATKAIESDKEHIGGKDLSELVQNVADCFTSTDGDSTYEEALIEVNYALP
jgi:uncharacterized FAD-dependent dehydrogenase